MRFVKCMVSFLVAMAFVCVVKNPAIAQEGESFWDAPWRIRVKLRKNQSYWSPKLLVPCKIRRAFLGAITFNYGAPLAINLI